MGKKACRLALAEVPQACEDLSGHRVVSEQNNNT